MFYDSFPNEQTVTDTNWVQIASKTGHLNTTANMIWISLEYTSSATNRTVGIRVLIDGVEVSFDHYQPTIAGQFHKFCDFGLYNSTEGNHTISLEGRVVTAGSTLTVRRIRLAIMQE